MINRQVNVNLEFSFFGIFSPQNFFWNANGLKHHTPELINLFIEKHIDIALISETHWILNTKTSFLGITPNRSSLWLCPWWLGHYNFQKRIQCQPLPNHKTNTIQVTNILITLNHIPTTISSVYCPPRPAMSFKHFSQFLNSFGRSFLIGDDFNAKHSQWSCQTKNTRARMLQNITYNTRIKFISPPRPTYWPSRLNRHSDILDYFLTTILRHNPFHKKSSRSSMLPQSSSSQSEL